MKELDLLDDLINEYNQEEPEDMDVILPAIPEELIDKLKSVFPDSVTICSDEKELQYYKGVQSIISFIEEQFNKQKKRGE